MKATKILFTLCSNELCLLYQTLDIKSTCPIYLIYIGSKSRNNQYKYEHKENKIEQFKKVIKRDLQVKVKAQDVKTFQTGTTPSNNLQKSIHTTLET